VLDEQGRKCQELGNTLAPQVIAERTARRFCGYGGISDFTESCASARTHQNVEALSPLAQHHPLHAGQSVGLCEKERIGMPDTGLGVSCWPGFRIDDLCGRL
jgi:hypothetical protein